MKKRSGIVIFFGTSGSGKHYVIEELAKDYRFEHIRKPSTRKMVDYDVENKGEVKIDAQPFGLNVVSKDDIIESDFYSETNGEEFSIPVGEIDRTILQGRVPAVILRSEEQIKTLIKMYPKVAFKKFYIRPDEFELKSHLATDDDLSKTEMLRRLDKVVDEYMYYDELAMRDKTVEILMHKYNGPERMIDVVKSELAEVNALPDPEDVDRTGELMKNNIVFGDKIRISFEEDLDPKSPTFEKKVWYAKVIAGKTVKIQLKELSLDALISKIISLIWAMRKHKHKIDMRKVAEIEKLFSEISSEMDGKYSWLLSETNFGKILNVYQEDILNLTNQVHLLHIKNGKVVGQLVIPKYVLDIDYNHLGFSYSLNSLVMAHLKENEKNSKKQNKQYHPIGYSRIFAPYKAKDFNAYVMFDSLTNQVKQAYLISQDETLFKRLAIAKDNELFRVCEKIAGEWQHFKEMRK